MRDQLATTTIEQVFRNPNSRRVEGTFLFPVPKGAHLDRFSMEIDGEIEAPIKRGQQLGVVNIKLDEELLLSENIVAMQDIAEGSLFVRAMDSIKLMFR